MQVSVPLPCDVRRPARRPDLARPRTQHDGGATRDARDPGGAHRRTRGEPQLRSPSLHDRELTADRAAGELLVVDVDVVVLGVVEDLRGGDALGELALLAVGEAVGGGAVAGSREERHDRAVLARGALVDVGAGGGLDLLHDQRVAQRGRVAVDPEHDGLAATVLVADDALVLDRVVDLLLTVQRGLGHGVLVAGEGRGDGQGDGSGDGGGRAHGGDGLARAVHGDSPRG